MPELSLDDMQQLVEADVAAEKEQFAQSPKGPAAPEISSDDILRGLWDQEDGDCELFCRLYRGRLCYDHLEQAWYEREEGGNWRLDKHNNVLTYIDGIVELYRREAARHFKLANESVDKEEQKLLTARRNALNERVKALKKRARKLNVLALAASGEKHLAVSGEQWDTDAWKLGVLDGAIDLRTGEHLKARAEDYIRLFAPVAYANAPADAPTWRALLDDVFDSDQVMIDYVLRVLGHALIGKSLCEHFFVFYGEGGNGKTVLIETIYKVLGPLAKPIPPAMLMDRGKFSADADKPSATMMLLRGLRIACASESKQGEAFDTQVIKNLSGGDKITARAPHEKRQMEFPQSHTLILLTNKLPIPPTNDRGFWRRMRVVPFEVEFVEGEPAPAKKQRRARNKDDLERALAEEYPAILCTLVKACLDAQKPGGLTPPAKVADATAAYLADSDLPGMYLKAWTEQMPGSRIQAGDLYIGYELWCLENHIKPISGVRFGKDMRKRLTVYESNVVWYEGIEWRLPDNAGGGGPAGLVEQEKERRKKGSGKKD
jgi:putative DNA primase/helicase